MTENQHITAGQITEARDFVGESQYVFCLRFPTTQGTLSRWEAKGPPKNGVVAKRVHAVVAPILSRKAKADEVAA